MGEQLYVYVEVTVGGFGRNAEFIRDANQLRKISLIACNSTAVYICRIAVSNRGINYIFLILPTLARSG